MLEKRKQQEYDSSEGDGDELKMTSAVGEESEGEETDDYGVGSEEEVGDMEEEELGEEEEEQEQSDASSEDEESSEEEEEEEMMEDNEEDSEAEDDIEEMSQPWTEGDPCIEVSCSDILRWQHSLEGPRPGPVIKEVCVAMSAATNFIYACTPKASDKYKIDSAGELNLLLKVAMKYMPVALKKAFKVDKIDNMALSRKYIKYLPYMELYLNSLLQIFNCTNADLQKCRDKKVKKEIHPNTVEFFSASIAPLHAAFRKDMEKNDKFVSQLISIWSQTQDPVKLGAVFNPIKEILTRDSRLYQKYVQEMLASHGLLASAAPAHTRAPLAWLLSLDPRLACHAAPRCLLPLQAHAQKGDVATVYGWAGVNAALLWAEVAALCAPPQGGAAPAQGPQEGLLALVTQTLEGCLQSSQSLAFLPARLHYASALLRLPAPAPTLLPALAAMLTALNQRKTKAGATAAPPTAQCLRLTEAALSCPAALGRCAEAVRRLLYAALGHAAPCPAFPDLAEPLLRELSAIKTGLCSGIARRLETDVRTHAAWLVERCQTLDCAVKDANKIRDFEIALRVEGGLPMERARDALLNKTARSSVKPKPDQKQKIAKKIKRKREKKMKKAKRLQKSAAVE